MMMIMMMMMMMRIVNDNVDIYLNRLQQGVFHIYDDDDDVHLDKLQTRGVKKSILYI